MPLTIEQYKELSTLESQETPHSFLDKIRIALVAFFTSPESQLTTLEKNLLEDNVNFTSLLVANHGRIITVNGLDLYKVYIPAKDPTKPTFVFIHGLGGNLQQFDLLFQPLIDQGYGVLAFDQPGFGLSSPEINVKHQIKLDGLADLTYGVIEKSDIKGELYIVGHSFGTQITINFINKYGDCGFLHEKVKKIWLLTPPKTPKNFKFVEKLFFNLAYHQNWIFTIFRKFDRLNNINSISVNRLLKFEVITPQEDIDYYKFKQFKYNLTTNTANFLNQVINWQTLTLDDLAKFESHLRDQPIKLSIIDGKYDKLTHQSGEDLHAKLHGFGEYHFVNGGHVITIDHYEKVLEYLLQ